MDSIYEAEAERVLSDMRGGDLLTVGPERSRNIIAAALLRAVLAERKRCAAEARALAEADPPITDPAAIERAILCHLRT